MPKTRPLDDVLTQLAAHLTGRAVTDLTSAWYREQRRIARNRMAYLTLAAVVALAAVIGGYQAYISQAAAERSTADKFIQTGLKAESDGDLIGAASAFRDSLRHADTSIGRIQLAELTNIPIRPLKIIEVPVKTDSGRLTALAFTAAKIIAVGDKASNLMLLDLDAGTIVQSIKLPSGVNALAFFPNDHRLFTGINNGGIFLIDALTGKALEWKRYSQPVLGLRAYPTKGNLAIGLANDAGVLVLSPEGKEIMRMDVHTDDVQVLAFNQDGTYLYWAGSGPYI